MTNSSLAFRLLVRAKVLGIHEHRRTVRGRRDPLNPSLSIIEDVSLGWFLHIDFDEDGIGEISIGVGPDRPQGVEEGDFILMTLERETKP